MGRGWIKGCGIAAVVVGLLIVAQCVRFFDATSHQSVEDCVAKMGDPILRKTATFPTNVVLKAKQARIEHQLYGNERQTRRLARSFEEGGWRTSVEPMDEIGSAAIIVEDPTKFRLQPAERVKQLCSIAEKNAVRYRQWSIVGPGVGGYVAQYSDGSVTQR